MASATDGLPVIPTASGASATTETVQAVINAASPGGANAPDWWLKQELYQFLEREYDADGVLVGGSVLWADGSGGEWTADEVDATWLEVNEYHVTHTDSGKTVTQPAITRGEDGQPTEIPELTVA